MANYPTQLDEIDQWLFDSFGIVAGACSSTENLRYNTAKMVAEALWPKKDQYGGHLKGRFGGPYKGEFIAEIDDIISI